jgi:hypothetical protein
MDGNTYEITTKSGDKYLRFFVTDNDAVSYAKTYCFQQVDKLVGIEDTRETLWKKELP